jgi:hypothetical protein
MKIKIGHTVCIGVNIALRCPILPEVGEVLTTTYLLVAGRHDGMSDSGTQLFSLLDLTEYEAEALEGLLLLVERPPLISRRPRESRKPGSTVSSTRFQRQVT